jgi:hypothetical protein
LEEIAIKATLGCTRGTAIGRLIILGKEGNTEVIKSLNKVIGDKYKSYTSDTQSYTNGDAATDGIKIIAKLNHIDPTPYLTPPASPTGVAEERPDKVPAQVTQEDRPKQPRAIEQKKKSAPAGAGMVEQEAQKKHQTDVLLVVLFSAAGVAALAIVAFLFLKRKKR